MADYAMVYPGIGSGIQVRKTERRNTKHTAAAFRRWFTEGKEIAESVRDFRLRRIFDLKYGLYERMY